ncbi:MAG: hypothetical protein ACHQVK_00095 [Candidatus Paceibacterales bacterium]
MQKYYSKANGILFWILIGLTFFIPLYPKFPLLNVNGTYVAVRLEDFLIAGALLIWILTNLKHAKTLLKENVTRAVLIFWLIGLLSLFSALTITFSVSPSLGFLNWLRRVESISLFFLAYTTIQNRKQLKIFLYSLLIVTVIVCLYGFGQVWAKLPVISTNNREFSKGLILTLTNNARPNSTFAGYYDLAVYSSMILVIFGSLFFYFRKTVQKGIILLSGLISAALLGMTAARTAFAAALIGLTAVFWILGKRVLIVGLILVSIVGVAAIPALRSRLVDTIKVNLLHQVGPTYQAPPASPISGKTATASANVNLVKVSSASANASSSSVWESSRSGGLPIGIAPGEPINTTELDVSRSVDIRTQVEWPRAIHSFLRNPFLGTGYGSLTIATDNDFLRSIGEVGILGTASLGLVLWILLAEIWRITKSDDKLLKHFAVGVFVMVLTFLANAVFIDVFEASKVAYIFWIITGVCMAFRKIE